jgi:hypothetical protein
VTTTTQVDEHMVDGPEKVIEMLRAQSSLYRRLEDCAARQRRLIVEDDAAGLLDVLATRKRLTDLIAAIGRRLAPIRQSWPQWRDRLAAEARAEADRLVNDSSASLRRLIEGDEQDCRVLSVKKDATARMLTATSSGAKAISAYRTPQDQAGRLNEVHQES